MGTPWITTGDLSDAMGVSAATARGTAVVTAACDMVRLFTGQTFFPAVTGGTVILDGPGTDALVLPQRPVLNAGTAIENVGQASAATLTLDTDYKLGADGILYRLPGVIDSGFSDPVLRNYWWPGRQNISVTYSYGFGTATLPSELKEVATQMARRLYKQDGNVVFESLGQHSIRYEGTASDFTKTEKLVLRQYKST